MDARGLIHRPLLLPDEAPRLLVIAPAGFGKTSLLRQWAVGRDPLWLTMATTPEAGEQLIPALCRALGVEKLPLEALLPSLAGRAVVLDDLQLLTAEPDRQALEALIEASDAFALALGSRTEPNLPALHRRRVRQQLTEVSAEALGFRGEDLRAWMAQMLPAPLASETLRLLEEKTQGWAAALVLTAQRLASLPPAQWHRTVETLSGHSQALYDYLAADLAETLPGHLYLFLLDSCVLPTLEPTPENRASLRELERRRLVLPGPRGGFVLHALLAEFLQARFEEESGHEALRVHCDQQAQRLWERGQWEAAFRLWWSHGFPERIAAAVAQNYHQHYLDYFPWVTLLPLAVLERFPLALRLRAVAETETRGEGAEVLLRRAEELLPPEEVAEAQLARVRLYRYRDAWEQVRTLLRTLEPRLTAPTPLRVRLLQEWAFYHYQHAALPQAGRTLDEAIALLQEVGGTPVQQASVLVQRATMTDLWQGDFGRIAEAARQIEALFGPQPPPVILMFLSVLEAEVAFHQGHPERVVRYQRLAERAQAVGYTGLKNMARCFLAVEEARQGASLSPEIVSPGMEYHWIEDLIRVFQTGAAPPGLTVTKPGSCLWWRFAEPLLVRGQTSEALRLSELAYGVAEELGNPFAKLMACYASALSSSGRLRLHECLELAQTYHYEESLLWQPGCERFLTLALAAGAAPELTLGLLERKGVRALCVRGFGGLRLESTEGEVRWPRPKARALFALLWLAGGKPVLVERVVAALWPDATQENGRQSYRTHCTYLRKALGEHCLETTQESVQLVLPESRFEDRGVLLRAHASDDSLLWEQALETIGADEFLPEFSAEDWAIPEREHLHRLRQELRQRLANHKLALHQPEQAVALCRAVLEEDSLDEDAALTAVTALVALERMSEARSLWGGFLRALDDASLMATLTAKNTIRKLGLA